MAPYPTLADIRSELDEIVASYGPNVRFYVDPNVIGIAWDCWDDDHEQCESGGVGPDFLLEVGVLDTEDVDDEERYEAITAAKELLNEIAAAGYTVA